MVPSSVAAVAVFLLLVAPGVAYELVRQRRRPARQDSVFIEVSRVLLAGVTLSLAGMCLLGFARLAGPGGLASPGELIANTQSYIALNSARVLATIVAYVIVTMTLAVFWADCQSYGGSKHLIVQDSAWFLTMARYAPPGCAVHVAVTMPDGTAYLGRKLFFTADPALGDRELVLQPPLSYRAPGTPETVSLPESLHRLILPASQITSMAITYVRKDNGSDEQLPETAHTELNRLRKRLAALRVKGAQLMNPVAAWWRRTPWWRAALLAVAIEFAILAACAAWLPGS